MVKELLQLIAIGMVPAVQLEQVLLIAPLLPLIVLYILNALQELSTIVQPLQLHSTHSAHLLLQEPLVQMHKTPGASLPTLILVLLTLIIAF